MRPGSANAPLRPGPCWTSHHFVTRTLMYVTGRSQEQVEHDPTPDREWRLLEALFGFPQHVHGSDTREGTRRGLT